MEYLISSPEEMIELAQTLLNSGYTKFALFGDLWAWKTHFSKWIAKGLGIDADSVHSPTYVYFHEYDDKLLHVDMYKMDDKMLIHRSWLDEKLEDYEYWCIEWPRLEWFGDVDMKGLVKVSIEIIDNQKRRLVVG